jgi:hypothetical protein
MKHLIVLPGNSPKNKAWGDLMIEHFGGQFDSVFMLSYDHWESGEANIDFVLEEENIRKHLATLPAGTEIVLFAKSAGSLLAFLAINHGAVVPLWCAFFGIPFDLASENLFKESWGPVDSFKIPAVAFHNKEDPTTSYEFTKTTLETRTPHISFITTNEADHWYGDVTEYEQYLNL